MALIFAEDMEHKMQKRAGLIESLRPSDEFYIWIHRAAVLSVALVVLLLSGFAMADELHGTWRGMLTRDGKAFKFQVTLSPAGYFVYSYTNNKRLTRHVELMTRGQKIQYVPSGGGVQTLIVESVVRQPGRLSYVMRHSFERASGGYTNEQYTSEALDFELTPQGLRTRRVTRSVRRFADKDQSASGGDETVAVGVLQKAE
jgi:hypothetical protein